MKTIEVNLGVGMNMLFPEPIQIVIDDTFENRYKNYLEFVKTLEDVDYDYITDDPNEYKLRTSAGDITPVLEYDSAPFLNIFIVGTLLIPNS